ncbi:MAG: cbb3-type cytochrome oxidase assembly protein CcoS [Kangiella sp.]|nr:cbb3-type cytochrome oxidase assembly protein CcoS [Kangiella sp.]
MDAIYLLIPLTLIFLAIAVGIFFWAVNSDQYSDLDKEASRILFEEKEFDEKGGEDKNFKEYGHKQNETEQSTKEDKDQPGSKA